MVQRHGGSKSTAVLIFLLLAGGLSGSALTGSLAKTLPILAATEKLGLQPATVDFGFMQLTFGLLVVVGPLTVLGFLLGYFIYRML